MAQQTKSPTSSLSPNRVREIRTKELNLTLEELADRLEISYMQLSNIEKGRSTISRRVAAKFESVFGIDRVYLMINPHTVIDEFDRELISRYHAAEERSKIAVDALLGIER